MMQTGIIAPKWLGKARGALILLNFAPRRFGEPPTSLVSPSQRDATDFDGLKAFYEAY